MYHNGTEAHTGSEPRAPAARRGGGQPGAAASRDVLDLDYELDFGLAEPASECANLTVVV